MIIGVDFDNTIVSYDRLFHTIATQQKLIPDDLAVNKIVIRDYLRAAGKEDQWTAMQGEAYGRRILESSIFPGVKDFFHKAIEIGHTISIISHKTKSPIAGPQYDLHTAALQLIQKVDLFGTDAIPETIFFELTKSLKIARIKAQQCELFIDDLPEVLNDEEFPGETKKILFAPSNAHANIELSSSIKVVSSWADLMYLL